MRDFIQRKAKRLRRKLSARYFADFVFVHINKTGGSSIERALGVEFMHMTALEKRHDIGEKRWEDRFSFAFVRNPWDRTVSQYHYRLMKGKSGLDDTGIGFPEWVRRTFRDQDPVLYNNPKMFMPQTKWVTDEAGEIIVKKIGRFERLADDFADICATIGREAELPHVKKSGRKRDYRTYYDDESLEIVTDWFADDARTFGYEFSDPSRSH